jgi:pimeloyl-ACP methyl ester carboxylesterase
MMLQTPQHVAVSEFENTVAPELWAPDSIDVPVLMVLAKQPMWNAEYEQFARSIAPQLDYQVWDNVSHFLMMEKPAEFTKTLLGFMRQHLLLPEHS